MNYLNYFKNGEEFSLTLKIKVQKKIKYIYKNNLIIK